MTQKFKQKLMMNFCSLHSNPTMHIRFQEKQKNANTVNCNVNTKDLTEKSKDLTIFISEIHQYIVEI